MLIGRALVLATLPLLAGSAVGQTPPFTERISVDFNGQDANGESYRASMSPDGRFVSFASSAVDLVPGDINGFGDVFLRDRQTNQTTIVSVSSSEAQGNFHSGSINSVSADGRFVAFMSNASNLDPLDTDTDIDVFVRDTVAGTTALVSKATTGLQHSGDYPSMSADGRFVAFRCWEGLVPQDTTGGPDGFDVYMHDRNTGVTSLVSLSLSNTAGNGLSERPMVSATGRYVAFYSMASDLVTGDTNGTLDGFVRDMWLGTTTRVTLGPLGEQLPNGGFVEAMSRDGRYVALVVADAIAKDGHSSGSVMLDRGTGILKSIGLDFVGAGGGRSVSDDGRYVALAAGFPGNQSDIYRRDMQTAQFVACDVSLDGSPLVGNKSGTSGSDPVISADGRYVVFQHSAKNLVLGDGDEEADIYLRDTYVPPPPPPVWGDLDHSLEGTAGLPQLAGTGTLIANSPVALTLSNAKPFSLAPLVVGLSNLSAPFKGGVMVPNPNYIFPLFTDFFGHATFGGLWPPGVPTGFTTYFQWWIQDPAGPQGYAASNAVAGTAP